MVAVVFLSCLRMAVMIEIEFALIVVLDNDRDKAVDVFDDDVDVLFLLVGYLRDSFNGIVEGISKETVDIAVRHEYHLKAVGVYFQIDFLLVAG